MKIEMLTRTLNLEMLKDTEYYLIIVNINCIENAIQTRHLSEQKINKEQLWNETKTRVTLH